MITPTFFRYLYLIFSLPGIVIHEIAHREFCRYYQIPVTETCYFKFGNPPGYVVHAKPRSYIESFMISVAPVFLNTGISLSMGILFAYLVTPFTGFTGLLSNPPLSIAAIFLTVWIGIATGIRALPSDQDANVIWEQTRANWYNPLIFVVIPIVAVIKVLNWLKVIYLPTVAGIAVFVTGVVLWLHSEQIHEFAQTIVGV